MDAATSKATPALIRAVGDRDAGVSDDAFRALRQLNRIIDVAGAELQAPRGAGRGARPARPLGPVAFSDGGPDDCRPLGGHSRVSSGHYATAATTAPAGVVAASARSNWRAASSQL